MNNYKVQRINGKWVVISTAPGEGQTEVSTFQEALAIVTQPQAV